MQNPVREHLRSVATVAVAALTAVVLAACTSSQPKSMVNSKKKPTKEYFSESEYGVKASPRVAYTSIPRGGGRDQIGKPYKVRGKMYYPKEDKNYAKVGLASWYGEAFHGRLTANGEIYDMTHLTAAHPTMPLPSYARVTNMENGASVVVRVNDRGPYAHDRLIDLSSRAADLLDYKRRGTAKVKVEYLGRAPLHGQDDGYLLASYQPGNSGVDPSYGLPGGVMIAMNGPTPSSGAAGAVASFTDPLEHPVSGPVAPERPIFERPAQSPFALASLSYAEESTTDISAFDVLEGRTTSAGTGYIAAGSFLDADEAGRVATALSAFGRTAIEFSEIHGTGWFSVNLHADGRNGIDEMLRAAWANGAPEAIAVRD